MKYTHLAPFWRLPHFVGSILVAGLHLFTKQFQIFDTHHHNVLQIKTHF